MTSLPLSSPTTDRPTVAASQTQTPPIRLGNRWSHGRGYLVILLLAPLLLGSLAWLALEFTLKHRPILLRRGLPT